VTFGAPRTGFVADVLSLFCRLVGPTSTASPDAS